MSSTSSRSDATTRSSGLSRVNLGHPKRSLSCPHCGAAFEAARRAMSIRCPQCTQRLELQDAVLAGRLAGTVSTLGHVRVTRRGRVRGRIECSSLAVEGSMNGQAEVRGPVRVDGRARLIGQLKADSITIAPGATINAHLEIGGGLVATSEVVAGPVSREASPDNPPLRLVRLGGG
jgi:cytoskeletal protein CcmA (bactofilin family)